LKKKRLIKKIYDFYSDDLTSKELENTLFRETPVRYKYYLKELEKSGDIHTGKSGILSKVKTFTKAFLVKLSPVIRIFYSAAIAAFLFAWLSENWNLAVLTFIVLNFILIYEIAEKLTSRDELKVARDLQISLIPKEPPVDDFFEVSYYYETAKVVGGDFIDFIKKNDSVYYISTGDISGKGMSAALYMIQVRLLMRQLSDQIENPKLILRALNENVFRHIKKGLYFSAVLTEVNRNKLKICRAGHSPVIYFDKSAGICREIRQNGMAVGLCEGELFDNALEEIEIEAGSGDIIFYYSDGLTESMNSLKEEFGLEKVKEILCGNYFRTAEDLKSIFLSEINKFIGYSEVHDDITLIILKAK